MTVCGLGTITDGCVVGRGEGTSGSVIELTCGTVTSIGWGCDLGVYGSA